MKTFYGVILIALLFSSCNNKFERELIGNYSNESCNQLNDGDSPLLVLELLKNKDFIVHSNDAVLVQGTWSAGDNGDFTWLNLHNSQSNLECRVSGMNSEEIELFPPNPFSSNQDCIIKFIKIDASK